MRRWVWLATIGCTGASGVGSDATSADGNDATTDSDDTGTEPIEPGLRLVVTDPEGDPVEGAAAQVILEALDLADRTDAAGVATFGVVKETTARWAVDVLPPSERVDLVGVSFGIRTPTAHRTVEVTLPRPGSAAALPATDAWLTIADGVEIFANQDAFEAALFEPAIDRLSASAISPWLPTDGLDGTVLGMWVFAPHRGTVDPAVPLRLHDDCGSIDCDSEALELWQMASLNQHYTWERRAPLTVEDGWLEGATLGGLGPIALVLAEPQ